jgi:hypothetical protein
MTRCMHQLQANATKAASNLDELQENAESEAVRLAASRATLEFSFRAMEAIDVIERLTAVEQKVNSPEWRNRNDNDSNHAPTRAARGANGHA